MRAFKLSELPASRERDFLMEIERCGLDVSPTPDSAILFGLAHELLALKKRVEALEKRKAPWT